MRIPSAATPEIQQAFRDVYALLDPWAGGRNIDLKGRRLINAGAAVEADDYVTFGQLRSQVLGPLAAVSQATLDASKLTGTTLAPNVVFSSLTTLGTLAAHLLFVDNTYDIGQSGATRPRHLYLAGLLSAVGNGTHTLGGAGSSLTHLKLTNTTSGAALFTYMEFESGTSRGYLTAFSQGFTTAGANIADSFQVSAEDAGGLVLLALNASGALRIYTGGTTEAMRVHASRGVSIGDTTDPGATNLRVAGTLLSVGDVRFQAGVRFGSHSALGAETVTGFITITDEGGASRKLAVVS